MPTTSISNKSKSILEEISGFIPNRQREELLDARAQNIMASAINLFEMIDGIFSEEDAELLKRRFFSGIKNTDTQRFTRTLRRIKAGNK